MKNYCFIISISILFIQSASAQKSLEDYQNLVSAHMVEMVSKENIGNIERPLFEFPNTFSTKKRDWTLMPKKGNGSGQYMAGRFIIEGNWVNYQLDGEFSVTFKGVTIVSGIAENGKVKEGTFYGLQFHMPLYSSDIPYEKHLVGTYSFPIYSGTIHHIKTSWNEDWLRMGTGVEYKRHYLHKAKEDYPLIYEAIYSERLQGGNAQTESGSVQGNTWYFVNKNRQHEDPNWDLFSASFIKDGKLHGEFVSANQDSFSVMATFNNGKNSHLYRVFDKNQWNYIDFDSQQFTYDINEEEPYKTFIDYHVNESWEDHLARLEKERIAAEKKRLKEEAEWEEVRRKEAIQRKEKAIQDSIIAVRRSRMKALCGDQSIAVTYGELTSHPGALICTPEGYVPFSFEHPLTKYWELAMSRYNGYKGSIYVDFPSTNPGHIEIHGDAGSTEGTYFIIPGFHSGYYSQCSGCGGTGELSLSVSGNVLATKQVVRYYHATSGNKPSQTVLETSNFPDNTSGLFWQTELRANNYNELPCNVCKGMGCLVK